MSPFKKSLKIEYFSLLLSCIFDVVFITLSVPNFPEIIEQKYYWNLKNHIIVHAIFTAYK